MNINTLVVSLLILASSASFASIQFKDMSEKLGFARGTESWGIAWGNLNGDKWPDLWNSGHRDYTRLYRNTGSGDFDDVSFEYDSFMDYLWLNNDARDAHGGAWGDFDNDGDDDLIVGDERDFFINHAETGGYFTRSHAPALPNSFAAWEDRDNDGNLDTTGCADNGFTRAAQLADINNDGVLDQICFGRGQFPDRLTNFNGSDTALTGLFEPVGPVSDAISGDFNNDLLTDYVVLRGFLHPPGAAKVDDFSIDAWFRGNTGYGFSFSAGGDVRLLFDGDGGGRFRLADEASVNSSSGPFSAAARGISVQYNSATDQWDVTFNGGREGYLRVRAQSPVSAPSEFGFASGDLPSPFYHAVNTGNSLDYEFDTGLADAAQCRSIVTADFDNDMDLDLYAACGGGVQNLPNRYYDNQGDGTFVLVSNHGGEGPVGVGNEFGVAESVITADYDIDGFVDLAVVNGLNYYPYGHGGPDTLLRNRGNGNHWLQIDLQGDISNRAGLGAIVFVSAGGVTQKREQNGGYHRWSQNHQRLHFGLAGNTVVDEIRIQWPSGQVDTHVNVDADQLYDAFENGPIEASVYGPEIRTKIEPGEECGKPTYRITYGPAMLLWRDCVSNDWHLSIRSGLGRLIDDVPVNVSGSILGDSAFGGMGSTGLSGQDTFTNDPADALNFDVTVQYSVTPTKDVLFNTAQQSSTCLSFNNQDIESLLIGSLGKRVDLPFDLATLSSCDVDTDGDGIKDNIDTDDDNDGVLDVDDDLPLDPNESIDTDSDGIGNNADQDDDGDGVSDTQDAFPLDPSESMDTDRDGIGNNSDIDADNDGITNAAELRSFNLYGNGTQAAPFLKLGMSRTVASSGVYYFELNGVAFSTFVDANGYAMVVHDRGDGTGDLSYSGNLNGTDRGVLSTQALLTLTDADEVRISHSGGQLDVSNNRQALIDRVIQNQSLGRGLIDNGVANVGWQGVGSSFVSGSSGCDRFTFGDTLSDNVFHGCGNGDLLHWVPGNNRAYQRLSFSLGEIPASETLSVWVLAQPVEPIAIDDTDGIANPFDLDSDNDTVPDIIEAGLSDTDGNWLVDQADLQGRVSTAPDTDADGIPDYLDLESTNPSNNGTAYDIASAGNAELDTNGDGRLTSADNGGGLDADIDGIDDLVDGDTTGFGSSADVGVCGLPIFDRTTEPGLFLSKDCSSGQWTVQVSGGGASSPLTFNGIVDAPNGFSSVYGESIEPNDVVDNLSDPTKLALTLIVGGSGVDRVYFQSNSSACFAVTTPDPSIPVYLGQRRNVVQTPIDLNTLQPCQTQPPVAVCGRPEFNKAIEQGVFLWKDCAAGEWELWTTGGGSPSVVSYLGNIESTAGFISITPNGIEPDDVLDDTSVPGVLSYQLNMAGAGRDAFRFAPASPDACVRTMAPDVPLYLGPDRLIMGMGTVQLDSAGACP